MADVGDDTAITRAYVEVESANVLRYYLGGATCGIPGLGGSVQAACSDQHCLVGWISGDPGCSNVAVNLLSRHPHACGRVGMTGGAGLPNHATP